MNAVTVSSLIRWSIPALVAIGLLLAGAPALAETGDWQQHMPAGDVLIPVVAILSVFGVPAVAVVLIAYFLLRYRERRQKLFNERIQQFLEAGQQVPETLLQDAPAQPATPERHLHQGLLLLGAGIGLTVFLSLINGFALGSLGLVLVGLGVAKVLIWKLSSRRDG